MINIFIKIFNKTHVLVFDNNDEITIYELFIKAIEKYILSTKYENIEEFIRIPKNLNFLNGCYLIICSKYYNLNYPHKIKLIDFKDLTIHIEYSFFKNNNLIFNSQ